jgi:hypothetical protein
MQTKGLGSLDRSTQLRIALGDAAVKGEETSAQKSGKYNVQRVRLNDGSDEKRSASCVVVSGGSATKARTNRTNSIATR